MSYKSISRYCKVSAWIIENYLSYYCTNKECLSSSLIMDGIQLKIKLYPRGVSSDYTDFISIFLEMESVRAIELECKLETTDREGNIFATNEFRVRLCKQEYEIGFCKFNSIDEVLAKMTKSKYDSLTVNCYMNEIQSESNSVTEFIARTIIGVERRCFTWCLGYLDTDLSKKRIIHFPKSSELEFKLSTSETVITITIIHSCFFDDVYYYEDVKQDDVKNLNFYNDRFLLCKISFTNIESKRLFTQQTYVDFEECDAKSRHCIYKFKKDLFKFDAIFPLQCEICLSYGTFVEHINSVEVD